MIRQTNLLQVIDRRNWLTVSEASTLSKYSKSHLRQLARKQVLESLRLATVLLIQRDSLLDYCRKSAAPVSGNGYVMRPVPVTIDQFLMMSPKQRNARSEAARQMLQSWLEEDRASGESDSYDILAALEANRSIHLREWSLSEATGG